MPGAALVCANLTLWELETFFKARAIMERYGTQCEAYGRSNARWNDRTTNAREGLSSATTWSDTKITTYFSHSVDYGLYLELRYDFMGRYEIVEETIEHDLTGLMASLNAAIGGGYGVSMSSGWR